MECPKCGAVGSDDAAECEACGLIFARWRPAAERATPDEYQYVPDEPSVAIPRWAIAVAIVLFIAMGIAWSVHRKKVREAADPTRELDSQINVINHAGVTARDEISKALATRDAAQSLESEAGTNDISAGSGFPAGLDEERASALIAGCFQENVELSIPRQFAKGDYSAIVQENSVLPLAVQRHLVEYDPPFDPPAAREVVSGPASVVKVQLTSLGQQSGIFREAGDSYKIDLGLREFDHVTNVRGWPDRAEIEFIWRYSDPNGTLFTNGRDEQASALFLRNDGVWKLSKVDVMTNGVRQVACR